jgi:PAS domain S-box-containing protein
MRLARVEPLKGQGRDSGRERLSVLEGIPRRWLDAFERFHRSTQQLQAAYAALQSQVDRLHKELEVTNRELEKNLREKERLEQYLRNIIQGIGVGIVVLDPKDRILMTNRAARTLLGLKEEDVGRTLHEAVERGALSHGDSPVVGVPLDVEEWDREVVVPRKGGEELWLRLRRRRLMTDAGTQMGHLLTVEDFTELRSMEEEMARTQRLAAMGEMAASIVHEVRNPLGSIQLFASLLAQEPDAAARREIVGKIDAAIDAVEHTLNNLLTFAKPLKPRLKEVDLRALLHETVEFVRPLAQRLGVEIQDRIPHEEIRVQADGAMIKQAVLNLFHNAFQAMPGGGSVRVWISIASSNRGGARGHVGEEWVELGIEDTGEGIPKEVLPRVFDPFFSTRAEGTGLGLAIVHNILRAHGGTVRITSAQGRGTTVMVHLPISAGEDHGGPLNAPERTSKRVEESMEE